MTNLDKLELLPIEKQIFLIQQAAPTFKDLDDGEVPTVAMCNKFKNLSNFRTEYTKRGLTVILNADPDYITNKLKAFK